MESIVDIREALEARSSTASLEELQNRGKSRVKVIRPEQIAAMVNEAVSRTIAKSGLVSEADAKRLTEHSQDEMKALMAERENQVRRMRELERDLEEERKRSAELAERLTQAREAGHALGTGSEIEAHTGIPGEAVGRLMLEVAEMKARLSRAEHAPAQAPAANGGLEAAIHKLAGSLEDRLEKFGKKLGVSGAAEAAEVDYSGLFKEHGTDQKVESNLDSMETTKSKGAGIGNALERLKKLRGG